MAETRFQAALLSPQDGETSVSFAGPITDHATATFAAILTDALATEPRRLVINLRHATSLNTTAVAVLNTAARHADACDISIVVRDPDMISRHRLRALEADLVTIEP
jgi:anti-anti-sigma regulatory factor